MFDIGHHRIRLLTRVIIILTDHTHGLCNIASRVETRRLVHFANEVHILYMTITFVNSIRRRGETCFPNPHVEVLRKVDGVTEDSV